ncbi:MAG: hypothetical protein JSV51_00175 [Candidatus Bathyarchaeota archaeon]|nr:MAG: hypothetical protein JSV51_00175 [Candidatus Bathyarchaeota archaeon]
MKLKAELILAYNTKREAKAVVKAVSPDNAKIPLCINIETFRSDSHLLASIQCKLSLETFIATLDDLLFCISIAEKTLGAIENPKS